MNKPLPPELVPPRAPHNHAECLAQARAALAATEEAGDAAQFALVYSSGDGFWRSLAGCTHHGMTAIIRCLLHQLQQAAAQSGDHTLATQAAMALSVMGGPASDFAGVSRPARPQ